MLTDHINKMCQSERSKGESERVNITGSVPTTKNNKPHIITFLVKWRKEIFKKNPALKEELREKIMADFAEKSRSTIESRIDLLKDTIFQLSESVRQNERYTAVIQTSAD